MLQSSVILKRCLLELIVNTHKQAIKFAPYGRRRLLPRAVYGERYSFTESRGLNGRQNMD